VRAAIPEPKATASALPSVEGFWSYALSLPEVIEVFHVTGADDFLLHIGLSDTDALRDFVLDRLTVRPEVGHVESRIVYQHGRRWHPSRWSSDQPSSLTNSTRSSPGPS
jgi:DNA-binding Lrp family transcriptional regulator